MDLNAFASLSPLQKSLIAVGGALIPFIPMFKIPLDLKQARTAHRKQMSDLFQELTALLKERTAVHPLTVQAKFQAATGSLTKWLPPGEEILDFLENRELATRFNTLEFADCAEFVKHSKSEKTFVPRGDLTHKEIRKQWLVDLSLYMISGIFGIIVATSPEIGPVRFLLAIFAFIYALPKMIRSLKLQRTLNLLKQTSKNATREKTPDVRDVKSGIRQRQKRSEKR